MDAWLLASRRSREFGKAVSLARSSLPHTLKMLLDCKESFEPVEVMAFLDDVVLIGKQDDCLQALTQLSKDAADIRLQVQPDKCQVLVPNHHTRAKQSPPRAWSHHRDVAPSLFWAQWWGQTQKLSKPGLATPANPTLLLAPSLQIFFNRHSRTSTRPSSTAWKNDSNSSLPALPRRCFSSLTALEESSALLRTQHHTPSSPAQQPHCQAPRAQQLAQEGHLGPAPKHHSSTPGGNFT